MEAVSTAHENNSTLVDIICENGTGYTLANCEGNIQFSNYAKLEYQNKYSYRSESIAMGRSKLQELLILYTNHVLYGLLDITNKASE